MGFRDGGSRRTWAVEGGGGGGGGAEGGGGKRGGERARKRSKACPSRTPDSLPIGGTEVMRKVGVVLVSDMHGDG